MYFVGRKKACVELGKCRAIGTIIITQHHQHHPALQLHFIQCPFPNRFQFGSEKNPKYLRTFSEPIPVRFGIFGMDFLITFPNRFQFGLEKIFEIVIAFSEPNSIEQKL